MKRLVSISSALVLALGCAGDDGGGDGGSEADEGTGGGMDDDASATGAGDEADTTGAEGADDDAGSSSNTETSGATTATDGSTSGGDGTTGGAGCGSPSPYAAGPTDLTIDVGGTQRTFVLALPSGYDENTAYPLVFALHGRTGNGALARLYFGIEQEAADQAVFLYPDGLPVMGGDTGWELAGSQDVDFFDALVDRFSSELCIDPDRIFATGHSFGGYFSNVLGCTRGDVLRAIAPVAGGGPYIGCVGQVAAWIAHGTNDPTVDITQGQGSREFWVAANACSASTQATPPSPCQAYDGCDTGYPVHWCEHPGEHEWPAFAAAGIWSFFASF